MKNLLLFTFLVSVTLSWGQQKDISLEQNTSIFISKLETKGISSYFTADRYCNEQTARLKKEQACESEKTYLARYVFWKQNGVTMVKLIDNCGMFTSYAFEDAAITDYYEMNAQDVQTNEVKPYIQATKDDAEVRSSGPANCNRVFMFKNTEGAYVKKYNMFDLSSEASKKNINAMHNNSISLVVLDKMLDDGIKQMEANSAWKRM